MIIQAVSVSVFFYTPDHFWQWANAEEGQSSMKHARSKGQQSNLKTHSIDMPVT
ncbi:hypothetical protein BaRGS_00027872, partial [Batillaria attramentaria]